MSQTIKTQMVDFEALEKTEASGRRAELAENVASLFALTSETCTVDQLDTYDMVFLRLADMVETAVRAQIAEKLAGLRRVPEQTVQKLARDEIVVARPILTDSVALSDTDLVDIATSLGIDHASAIAGRDVLSDVVTDGLIDLGNVRLLKTVVENTGAKFSEAGFDTLLKAAVQHADLQPALADRSDLPDRVLAGLVKQASASVRERLMRDGCGQDAGKAEVAGAIAFERMSNEYWLSRYDFESAWQNVCETGKWGPVNENLLRKFAMQDRFAEAAATFSALTGMSFEQAKHWLVRSDPTPFLTTARALGFDRTTVQSMLGAGPWRHRLTVEERAGAYASFVKMDRGSAQKVIRRWRNPERCAA